MLPHTKLARRISQCSPRSETLVGSTVPLYCVCLLVGPVPAIVTARSSPSQKAPSLLPKQSFGERNDCAGESATIPPVERGLNLVQLFFFEDSEAFFFDELLEVFVVLDVLDFHAADSAFVGLEDKAVGIDDIDLVFEH